MKIRMLGIVVVLLCLVGLIACAPNAVMSPMPKEYFDQDARAQLETDYTLGPGDVIDIRFETDVAAASGGGYSVLGLPIRPDGRISILYAPDLKAAGLTPSELSEEIKTIYSKELRKPDVVVVLRSFGSRRVYVDGEVAGPRFVELTMPTTVLRAIAQVGGLRESARLSNVIVIRPDLNGRPAGTMVDLRKVIDGTDFKQDIYLMPNDIVYVPKSNIARVDKFVEEYITRVIPGLGTLSPYPYVAGTPAAPLPNSTR